MADGSRVVLVTGASSGFGRAIARRLAARGDRVYGTSRRPAAPDLPWAMLEMDVCDDASVERGVARLLEAEGRVDALVNNAGIAVVGSVEDTRLDEARLQIETNLFGVLRVTRAVLPAMRRVGAGRIVNIGSLAGLMGLPFQGLYSASKFALEGLTEALRLEVAPFGIRVANVDPGDFRTEITEHRIVAEGARAGAYARQFEETLAIYEREERQGSEPEQLARLVEQVLETPSPRVRYRVGPRGQTSAALLKRVVGSRLFEGLMRRHCGIRLEAS